MAFFRYIMFTPNYLQSQEVPLGHRPVDRGEEQSRFGPTGQPFNLATYRNDWPVRPTTYFFSFLASPGRCPGLGELKSLQDCKGRKSYQKIPLLALRAGENAHQAFVFTYIPHK